MDNFLIDTLIDKINKQESQIEQSELKLADLDNKVAEVSNLKNNVKSIAELVNHLQIKMNQIIWPKEQINELFLRLKLNNDLHSKPVIRKQKIVHTAEKSIWIIVVLIVLMNILLIEVININNKLDRYKTNDILWRGIKVNSHNHNLEYLQSIEQLYNSDPDNFKSAVVEAETRQKQILESEINNVPRAKKDSVRLSRSKHIQ